MLTRVIATALLVVSIIASVFFAQSYVGATPAKSQPAYSMPFDTPTARVYVQYSSVVGALEYCARTYKSDAFMELSYIALGHLQRHAKTFGDPREEVIRKLYNDHAKKAHFDGKYYIKDPDKPGLYIFADIRAPEHCTDLLDHLPPLPEDGPKDVLKKGEQRASKSRGSFGLCG